MTSLIHGAKMHIIRTQHPFDDGMMVKETELAKRLMGDERSPGMVCNNA